MQNLPSIILKILKRICNHSIMQSYSIIQSYFTPKDGISEVGIGVEVSEFSSNASCAYAPFASSHLFKVGSIRKTEKVRREICATTMETWLK